MDGTFVQPPEHRPVAPVAEATGVPVIDLSPLAATPPPPGAADELAAEVGAACRDWGFFVAAGHGVPEAAAARAVEAGRAFFALPPDRKAAVRRTERAPLGYYDAEHAKNVRDWKGVFDIFPRELPPPDTPSADGGELVFVNKWPGDGDVPGFRLSLARSCLTRLLRGGRPPNGQSLAMTLFLLPTQRELTLFHREALEEYAAAMEKLAFQLLELLARSWT